MFGMVLLKIIVASAFLLFSVSCRKYGETPNAAKGSIVVQMEIITDNLLREAFKQSSNVSGVAVETILYAGITSVKARLALLNLTRVSVELEGIRMINDHVAPWTEAKLENLKTRYKHDSQVRYLSLVYVLTSGPVSERGRTTEAITLGKRACTSEKYIVGRIRSPGKDRDFSNTMLQHIAEALGAEYDGKGEASRCPSADRHLMTLSHIPKTPYSFSNCSDILISNHMSSKETNCTTKTYPSPYFKMNLLLGEIFSTKQLCSMRGIGYSDCTLNETSKKCHYACCKQNTEYRVELPRYDGGKCGDNGEMCLNGECRPKEVVEKFRRNGQIN